MKISIGIMAWNEADVIGVSLQSLFEQNLLQCLSAWNASLEIIVVPNGCTDLTAQKAAAVLNRFSEGISPDRLTWRVCELKEPGKVNAWNQYVHRLSDPVADCIFLMDADIRFTHPDTLTHMIRLLEDKPHVFAATDLPQKHVLFKKRKNIFDRISLSVAAMTRETPGQLTGQLYCARGPLLRRIHLPLGLMVEDGFIKSMICTELYRQPIDNRRIERAPDASHVFESYTRLRDIYFHQRRQQIGHTVYVMLRDYLVPRIGEQDAGEIIRDQNAVDPEWFLKLIRQRIAESGWWVIYPGAFSLRFRRLRNFSFLQRLVKGPVALMAFCMDVIVLAAANHNLKSGQFAGVWKDTKTTRLGMDPS